MLLCSWETNTCFFLGHLSCDLCWYTKSLWHIASLCFFLSFDNFGNKRWKQQVHLLQYAFQFHHNCSFFVSHLSCQWNSFCIFQNALFLHVLAFFCHRPCFELTAATELLNLVPKILSSDLVFLHRHTLTHRLMTATLLL